MGMAVDFDKIRIAKDYLRDKYATAAEVRQFRDTLLSNGFEYVTITGTNFEGASSQGQSVFSQIEYLGALNELIGELDPPSSIPKRSLMTFGDFGGSPVRN